MTNKEQMKALYLRIDASTYDKLDRAAFILRKTKKELIEDAIMSKYGDVREV